MPDLDLVPSSRVCPSCGRRVPRKIDVCRCGTSMEGVADARETSGEPRALSPVSNTQGSRECPACGRRVPAKIEACRCGTKLPPVLVIELPREGEPLAESDFEEGFPTVLGVAAFMCCLVVFLYWLGKPPVRTLRPPPPTLEMMARPREALEAEPATPDPARTVETTRP